MAERKKTGPPKGTRPAGRTPGTPNKRSLDAAKRLEDLGADPLERAAKIMLGNDCGEDHPFLAELRRFLARFRANPDKITEKTLKSLEGRAEKMLSGHVPLDLQARMATELMKYLYPQRKAIDVKNVDNDHKADDVSDEELAAIAASGQGKDEDDGPAVH